MGPPPSIVKFLKVPLTALVIVMRSKISLREETENRSQHSLCAETISRLVLLMTDVKWLLAEMIGT